VPPQNGTLAGKVALGYNLGASGGHLMAKAVGEIERDFLALNGRDRADVLRALLGHLDDPHDQGVEDLWLDEAERRLGEIEAGTAKTHPAEQAFREIRAQLK
jgi:hypothetical protein